jgi:hypothetical protein
MLIELNFLDRSSKNTQISNLTKNLQWEPNRSTRKDGRTDGRTDARTDMTKPNSHFRNFANAPKTAMVCAISASRRRLNKLSATLGRYGT